MSSLSQKEILMTKTKSEAPFSYEGLDRVIHEKARLGILTSLIAYPKGLSFAELKHLCGLTDGNLSRHLQVLQDASLVKVQKTFRDNKPHTSCKITAAGKKRFLDYISVLEKVVHDASEYSENTQDNQTLEVKGQLKPT